MFLLFQSNRDAGIKAHARNATNTLDKHLEGIKREIQPVYATTFILCYKNQLK